MKRIISRSFIVLGLLLLTTSAFLVIKRHLPSRLSFQNVPENSQVQSNELFPTEIIIPDLDIDLPVISANLTDNHWQTTSEGVSYLATSPTPGEEGNSILYGHNWSNLLGGLTDAKAGQEIIITLSNGNTQKFTIANTKLVSPQETAVLEPTDTAQITLYTCSGLFDQYRLVVTAIPT